MNSRHLLLVVRPLVGLGVMLCGAAHSDVVYGPSENHLSSRARLIQGVAAVRATWGVFLDEIKRGQVEEASKFILPGRRSEFVTAAGSLKLAYLIELRSKVQDMPCRLDSDTTVNCIATMPSSNGNLEDIQLPARNIGGVWYITW